MKEQTQSAIRLLEALTERAKELTCLYAIEEALREPDADIDQVCDRIISAIPPGWQYPDICAAKLTLEGQEYYSEGFEDTPWQLSANIVQQDQKVGSITVCYTKELPTADVGPFLKEEKKLVETIADRVNHFLTYKKMKHVVEEWRVTGRDRARSSGGDWEAVLDLIRQTDNALFLRLSNKMLNHLCSSGVEEAEALRREYERRIVAGGDALAEEVKGRGMSRLLDFPTEFTERIFRVAAEHLGNEEILSRVQMWIEEDKLGVLLRTVRRRLPLSEVMNNLRRYFFTSREETDGRYPLARGLKVLLLESVLSSRLDYINAAKDYITIEDFYHLLQNVIVSSDSHGKLGGKSAGLFLASLIVKKSNGRASSPPPVELPKTWHISSDMMLEFIHYNNMDEIIEQKYKDVERVRLEYPHVIAMFRQSVCPPEMANGLSMALDDFGERPLVVRSSSLLEDRTGSSFCGKYKTVFLGNRGRREDRLQDLMRAVAEVYASNFGPDPIEYRMERGLLEFSEQIGVMIQEVVGTRVGEYFTPAYSGMARSRNDLPCLPGIAREDPLVRIVPGLGTRAADHTGGEYPILVVPGRPSIRGGRRMDDAVRHAPKHIDVINLGTNRVETLELGDVMSRLGHEYPRAEQILSCSNGGEIRPLDEDASGLVNGDPLVTFDGLINRSPFANQIGNLLRVLEDNLGTPVEIEFASDGQELYLLQCCPQTRARSHRPCSIPKDISSDRLVLWADRHISNGCISNLTHIIYLRPEAREVLAEPAQREAVSSAVAQLGQLLPKRQFMVITPDFADGGGAPPAGSRLSFVDIKNAAVVVDLLQSETLDDREVPIGVHLLQDLLDSGIHYLPICSESGEGRINERFLLRTESILSELLPEYEFLEDVVRVIDVPAVAEGKVLQLRMNAELEEAVGLLVDRREDAQVLDEEDLFEDETPEHYWRWRCRMAEQIASQMDPEKFGVTGVYLFGSTKNGTAGPGSDIDILVHFTGTATQRESLVQWLEGWSLCLDEINYLRTGYRSGGLLDYHIITDKDIAKRTSYAAKIDAITDAARPLKMNSPEGSEPGGRRTKSNESRKGALE